ncbi:immunomodulatory protein [Lactarius quietus]|nr:immunomodulatory protein [Lactarius quietus]
MKLTSTIISLVALFSIASAVDVDVRYNEEYDNPKVDLDAVACSDGPNGLLTKKYTTFGSLPSFPYIGAAQAVGGWDSPACGSCWQISYGDKSINVTAVDHSGDGFILSLKAVNALTYGDAEEFGVIKAQAKLIDKKYCGLH